MRILSLLLALQKLCPGLDVLTIIAVEHNNNRFHSERSSGIQEGRSSFHAYARSSPAEDALPVGCPCQSVLFIIPSLLEYHQHITLLQEGECAMYTTVKLIKVEANRSITREGDSDFFFELQRSVLLSLKEDGKLTQMQYRNAEEALKEQRSAIIRAKIEGGSTS